MSARRLQPSVRLFPGATPFGHAQSVRVPGVRVRPVEEMLADPVTWYDANGDSPAAGMRRASSGETITAPIRLAEEV